MKRFLALFFLTGFLFSCGGNEKSAMEIGQYTTIEVQKVYNMGTVAKGQIVRTEIEVKNTGDYPLIIADVKPSCSCTVPFYEEEPIAPGTSTTIIAEVDTDKTGKGKFSKPINITANTRPSTTQVTIEATVIN